jgi:NADH-quinone oxidoreductase subunit A
VSEATRLVVGALFFAAAGTALGLGALLLGKVLRPSRPGGVKGEIYECGEPTIGSAWVQFDLRFYVVALLFVLFAVEIAMLYPWAILYNHAIADATGRLIAVGLFWEMLFFFGLLILGYLYLLKFGYLDWVRSTLSKEQVERK